MTVAASEHASGVATVDLLTGKRQEIVMAAEVKYVEMKNPMTDAVTVVPEELVEVLEGSGYTKVRQSRTASK